MILVDLAPLQQQAASAVPDHDREGTMQVAALMRFQLFLSSDFIVSSIDEDDVFAGHRMISSLHMPPRRPHHSIAVSEVAPRPVYRRNVLCVRSLLQRPYSAAVEEHHPRKIGVDFVRGVVKNVERYAYDVFGGHRPR